MSKLRPLFKLRTLALAALTYLAGCTSLFEPPRVPRWAVYYDEVLEAEAFQNLDLVVFDRHHHPKLDALKGRVPMLGYVSIGEVFGHAPEKAILEKEGLLIEENTLWKSYIVDVSSPKWKAIVLGYVDDVAAQGFDGVMLDTGESPIVWAQLKNPTRLKAMENGIIDIIKAIHKNHPNMKIMVNRAFRILPAVANDIDYVLAESIYTNTNVSTGQYALFPPNTVLEVAKQLHHLGALAPHLKIFTLDYWNMDDVNGLERIYAAQRAQGFIPYVTTPDLRSFTPEPVFTRLRR
jgi:uncharacterized protein (TIGR01370 family)